MSDDEDTGGASTGKLQPKQVLYCGVCGLPPEFCEFGPEFDKCKPWLQQYSPHTYPELAAAAQASSSLEGLSVSDAAPAGGASTAPAKATGEAAAPSEAPKDKEEKKLPGGKKKKQVVPEVIVEKITRNKRKSVTTIKGLEHFGVKLPDAAKKLGKKFACGASVTKGVTEKEQIDVQGDIILDIGEYLTETWPEIPQNAVFTIEDGRKVPAC